MPESITHDGRTFLVLCAVGDVDDDTPVQVNGPGIDYAVFSHEGSFYVTADLCTHGPGSLAEGYVEGCEVECPFHQGKFDFITGLPTSAPCDTPLRIWTPIVVDGQVCIDPDEKRGG